MDHDINSAETAVQSRESRVVALAYSMWEKAGQPKDRSDEHWYMACTIIDAQDSPAETAELPPWLNRPKAISVELKPQSKVTELPQQHRHKSAA
jgi:Protein of unknown function (DUF2934)